MIIEFIDGGVYKIFMKPYIFLTSEGYTFQPDSDSVEPDIDNCQVIGFSEGENAEEAFRNLLQENEYLLETKFDEIYCYQLADKKRTDFSLKKEIGQ
ncbi:hypothetical protein Tfer_3161 [Thermincola ferriacetica]|uniref:Uncharacterized protein n=1 Tax=Thermincola ferriacetica TaxID=281456 RepID=A0A0L6VZM8_9FIRM|nr:hypothetical protein [Thermincola ferriacetica]KNZ68294.1 hypothetical protein Tfer_3161 [Thermincola ferriacetica]